jgi:Pyridine nucleotide-disulphide oxidoreductase
VAAGLRPFVHVPAAFAALPAALASHTATAPDLASFAGKSVVVIGGGQSALESAALLHESGAEVEVLVRAPRIFWLSAQGPSGHFWADAVPPPPPPRTGPPPPPSFRARHKLHWRAAPTELGGRFTSWIGAAPDVCRVLPYDVRLRMSNDSVKAAGAYWLPDRLRDVPIMCGRTVLEAREQDGRVLLRIDDGGERTVDHVLLGTGYKMDVRRYAFLAPELAAELRVVDGYPQLRRGLESSVAGLHFLGAPAYGSFGPTMRFVIGTAYDAPALVQGILGRRMPLFRWAF